MPLLEIVNAPGLPIRSKGKSAPLEARLLVRGGLLMIRPEDRGLPVVRIGVTVRELLDGLWPPRRPCPRVQRAGRELSGGGGVGCRGSLSRPARAGDEAMAADPRGRPDGEPGARTVVEADSGLIGAPMGGCWAAREPPSGAEAGMLGGCTPVDQT